MTRRIRAGVSSRRGSRPDAIGTTFQPSGSVVDEVDRRPLQDVTLQLSGRAYGAEREHINETTDTDGVVNFGAVRFGRYDLLVYGSNEYRLGTQVSIKPGSEQSIEIVHPRPAREGKLRID